MTACRWTGAFAAALILAAGPALAASDYLLELDGVPGEGAAKGGKQTIEVASWSWGATNAGASASGGGATGKVSVQDLSVTAAPAKTPLVAREAGSGMATGRRAAPAADLDGDGRPDVAAVRDVTVTLPEAAAKSMCANGTHFPKASLTARGERVELENVVVTSCTTKAGVSTVGLRGHQKTGHVTLLK